MEAPQGAVLLRIYTEEGKMNNHRPLYEDIVMKARAAKLAGALACGVAPRRLRFDLVGDGAPPEPPRG